MAAPQCDATSPKLGSPSSTVRISWGYKDRSGKNLIDPTAITDTRLYDLNDVWRTPADTAVVAVVGFTPTKDTTGAATGTIGKYYVDVALHSAAEVGQWYIKAPFTHEGVTLTQYICFNVVASGADVTIDDVDTYATKESVLRFMSRNNITLGSGDKFKAADIEVFIDAAEAEIDRYLNRTWKSQISKTAPDGSGILCELQFSRMQHALQDYVASFKVPFGPIQSITKLEVFRGGQGYQDVTADVNNENRPNGIWFDPNGVEVFIGRNIIIPYTSKNAIRIKYKAGLGSGEYVAIPEDVKLACDMLASATFLESSHWSKHMPSGQDPMYYHQIAKNWRSMAYAKLELHRGFVWA